LRIWKQLREKWNIKSERFFQRVVFAKNGFQMYNQNVGSGPLEQIGNFIDETLGIPKGKKRTFHCFKATSINFLLSEGYSVNAVAGFAGNTVASIQKYVRPELLQKTMSEKDPFKEKKEKKKKSRKYLR